MFQVSNLLLSILLTFAALSASATTWKGIFVAGDNSIENFDNGRKDLTTMFDGLGLFHSFQLSTSSNHISETDEVYKATAQNIQAAFSALNIQSNEGCLIHMTSHGAKSQGFYLKLSGILPPALFSQWVNQSCGQAPTVILVSACFSGQFITENLKGPNRVIMTAARSDRPSFGCSADTEYTYWDACLLEEIPKANTWVEAYSGIQKCITQKESDLGAQPSEPQAFFGANTKNWKILE
jgi:hypothetical protein